MWDGKENGGGHFRKNRYANAEHPETILVCWWPMQGWKDTLSLDCEMLGQWGRQSPEQCIPKPDFPIKWSNLKLNMQCLLLPMDAREYLQGIPPVPPTLGGITPNNAPAAQDSRSASHPRSALRDLRAPPPAPATSPSRRSGRHRRARRELLFRDFLPGPAEPGVLSIRRGSGARFYPKEQNCHFRKGRKLQRRSHRAARGAAAAPRTAAPRSPAPLGTAPGPAPAPYLVIGGQAAGGAACAASVRGVGVRRGCSCSRSLRLGWGPTRPRRPALGTMGLGARGGWAVLILGALLVLALLKATEVSRDLEGSANTKNPVLLENSSAKPTETTSHTTRSSNNTVKPSTTPVSLVSKNVTVTAMTPTAKLSTTPVSSVSKNVTVTTLKSTAASKMTPPGVLTNTTSITSKSTPKITSASQNTSQLTTTHNSSVTSISSSVTITATINSKENKGSKFDSGSFVGGIVLTLGILSVLYIGCKMYYSRRGIRYRTIDEHDAII
ncbi:porimin [Manis javanica]|uniref:porimin n=1 Tax=Manis javanica TaxID=9974 RepID=UPI003C6DAC42